MNFVIKILHADYNGIKNLHVFIQVVAIVIIMNIYVRNIV